MGWLDLVAVLEAYCLHSRDHSLLKVCGSYVQVDFM